MRILVSNDDGVHAEGLWALVRALQPLGEIIVSAPDRDQSGVGAALSLHGPLRVREMAPLARGVRAYAVEGTPGDAVVLGIHELAGGALDLVASGVNPGNNVAADLLMSGTVGAAFHACQNGLPAFAVSTHSQADAQNEAVAETVRSVARQIAGRNACPPLFLNLNFPDLADGPARGARHTSVAPRVIFDNVVAERRRARTLYWNNRVAAAAEVESAPEGSDVWALRNRFVSVTALTGTLLADGAAPGVAAVVEAAGKALTPPLAPPE